MSKTLTSCALIILWFLASSASRTVMMNAASAGDEISTSVPFDPANNLIVMTATLNGKGPFRFLLDTGASHHVMKPEVAQALGLKVTAEGEIDAGARGTVEAGLVEVEQVRVGSFTLERQRFFVTPFPPAYPFEGFLGADLFKSFTVSIDFRQSMITLTKPDAFRYQGAGLSLPLKFQNKLIPQVKAQVDEDAGLFKLDTGYNGSIALFWNFIERNGLMAKYAPRRSEPGGQTLTGEVGPSPVVKVRSFRLGGSAFSDMETTFFLEKGGSNSAFAGAIGTALLRRFHLIVIDYKRQRLILE